MSKQAPDIGVKTKRTFMVFLRDRPVLFLGAHDYCRDARKAMKAHLDAVGARNVGGPVRVNGHPEYGSFTGTHTQKAHEDWCGDWSVRKVAISWECSDD